MSEQSSQQRERDRERPFLETKRILAGAGGVQAGSVSLCLAYPGSGDHPPPAAQHRPPQVGTKAETEAGHSSQTTRGRESYTTCAVTTAQPGPDNNWSVFWKYK